MERITIYPSSELKKRLEKEAQTEQRSINNLILFILNKYFGGSLNGKPNTRKT